MLVAVVIAIAVLLRIGSWLWYAVARGGRLRLVIHPIKVVAGLESEPQFDPTTLSVRIRAFIGEEATIGTQVVVPGSTGLVGPTVPAEAPGAPDNWVAALMWLAFAREPTYHVHLTLTDPLRVVAEITRSSDGRSVAARTFSEANDKELVAALGCFCIQYVRRQRSYVRRTPRWERWNPDSDGYRSYRAGLAAESRGLAKQAENVRSESARDEYRLAISHYAHAARLEPGNLRVRIRWGHMLELLTIGRHGPGRSRSEAGQWEVEPDLIRDSVRLYRMCLQLWQAENIEISYRLAAVHVNGEYPESSEDPRDSWFDEAIATLDDMNRRLAGSVLLRRWLRGWLPTHWSPGERRYWFSWFRRWNAYRGLPALAGHTKRHHFACAMNVARDLTELHRLIRSGDRTVAGKTMEDLLHGLAEKITRAPGRRAELARTVLAYRPARSALRQLLRGPDAAWARRLVVWDPRPATARLFHPERFGVGESTRAHDPEWHGEDRFLANGSVDEITVELFPTGSGESIPRWSKSNIGWLAHYNAACFCSVAIDVPPPIRPGEFEPGQWELDCARAALRELGYVLRDPFNALDPTWLRQDPDLENLRQHPLGRYWADFVGVPVQRRGSREILDGDPVVGSAG
jgi:hypothetical protein